MTALTIIVEFETHEGREEEFIALIREHARKTLEEEPGCLRFEVIKPIERNGTPIANKVMVNELYANEAAVTAHENNPRLPRVRAANAPLLKSSRLILAQSLTGKAPEEGLTPQQLNASNDD
ncbi:quinol monooxygenase YgiN [Phyllobacterium trifolii]|jgi:autoinducer 2-degrading protein|uniref:Quinol monooxygenase YgiN n=1 Tax=Phyllobacterium trifolii TaxID=300193 RepID=A0A839U4L1_9HYPH|nr:putative quinol monooxygenase [Phyllobacterium trifolii]MBB3143671.1 quinol monooxygenase YgiN [Phyllobacterium trifolii]